MMWLILAVLALVATVLFQGLAIFATGMSDNPQETVSYAPLIVGLPIVALFFAGWWFRW